MRTFLLAAIAVASLAGPAHAANLASNPGFEMASASGPSLTVGAGASGPSAAAGWDVYLNSPGTVATSLVPSTDTIAPGGHGMIQVTTNNSDNGLFQYPVPLFDYLSADIFVISGAAQLVATNSFHYVPGVVHTTQIGVWQHLSLTTANANEIVIYSSGGPANFFVDNVYAGTAPQTGDVPEPASWFMLIAGFGLTGAAMRRRRQVSAYA